MKKNLGKILSLLLAFAMLFCLFGCAEEAQETTSDAVTNESKENVTQENNETETKEEEVKPPVAVNPLTGLACEESVAGQRPIAVMFNNIKDALPQTGVAKCDIIYEMLVEGGILRLEGLIHDYAAANDLGSIRSARPSFVELSTAYDAIYVHGGRSATAESNAQNTINELGVNNLNGVEGPGGGAFFRDEYRTYMGYAYEHTLYTRGSNLVKGISSLGYRTKLKDASFTAFKFNSEMKSLESEKSATYVKIPHSNYSVSEFKYNETTGLYGHIQYGQPHIDTATGKQIAFENVFVLFADHTNVGKYVFIDLVGEGKGYYITDGKAVSITWKRESQTGTFSYFNEDGSELSVRCGKSYVSVANSNLYDSVTIS